MDALALKGKIRAEGKTQSDAAKMCGISLSTFNAKINGTNGAEFALGEIVRLRHGLHMELDEAARIFLS